MHNTYRLPFKNEAAEFHKRASAMLESLGAVKEDSDLYGYNLETIYGRLRIGPCDDFIAARFEERERLPDFFDHDTWRRSNGKWNHHFSGFKGRAQIRDFTQLDEWLESVRSHIYRLKPEWISNQQKTETTK